MFITDDIIYVGVDDTTLDLFESQYKIPYGVSYNSYVIMDEKITIMDSVDCRKTSEWIANIHSVLKGKRPEYIVLSHLEPDHAGSIAQICNEFPNIKLVGNTKTFAMLPQFFNLDLTNRIVLVNEGFKLELGKHTLQFFMAPMVHWPEVMVSYELNSKILFSADAFGTFGAIKENRPWIEEARRYYINIVGKYGIPTQQLLKKVQGLDISMICPLHGPILNDNLGYYIDKYNKWSSYIPEEKAVLVAYASIHGNTAFAAKKFAKMLEDNGNSVLVMDLSRSDMSIAVEKAFQYDRLVVACATYDGGLFPVMEDFLNHLKSKGYQNRKVGLIENGSWAPMANKKMLEIIGTLKKISVCEPMISIKSTLNASNIENMNTLAKELSE